MATLETSSQGEHFDGLLDGQLMAVAFQTINFAESFGGEITLPAVGAAYHGNILNDQQRFALAVRFRNAADARAGLAANVADVWPCDPFFHSA